MFVKDCHIATVLKHSLQTALSQSIALATRQRRKQHFPHNIVIFYKYDPCTLLNSSILNNTVQG